MGFALITGILLLNILIVEIGRIYTQVDKFGRFEFWTRRLAVVNEIACSFSWLIQCFRYFSHRYNFASWCRSEERFPFANTSTWVYQDLDNYARKSEVDRDFFFWYRFGNSKFAKAPKCCERWKVFVNRAPFGDCLFPGESFERALCCDRWKTLSRFAVFISYPFVLLLLLVRLLPGILFGIFLPLSVKKDFFYGPLEEAPTSDQNVKSTNEKVIQMETEIIEVHKKLGDLIALLKNGES